LYNPLTALGSFETPLWAQLFWNNKKKHIYNDNEDKSAQKKTVGRNTHGVAIIVGFLMFWL